MEGYIEVVDVCEHGEVVGGGYLLLPLQVLEDGLKGSLVAVLHGVHVPADQVVQDCLAVLALLVDRVVVAHSVLLQRHELLVVLRRQLQPSLVHLLVGGVVELLQLLIHPLLRQQQVSLHLC